MGESVIVFWEKLNDDFIKYRITRSDSNHEVHITENEFNKMSHSLSLLFIEFKELK